ncbi:MAG: hypothetical protein IKP15_03935 [Bacteroidales bacterium]|nr:hypothetical protein [Bacteroidales bacterium]
MKNPLVSFCRWMALRRGRSTVPTKLLPLAKVRVAKVFVDTTVPDEDPERVCRAVQQFFDYQGIPVLILCPAKRDVNWRGFLKKRVRGSHESRQDDLFISLAASPENFAAEYEARCSTAIFKVGRCQLPGDVFDLVVAVPENGESSQLAAFSAIKDYLNKIR